jgi:hypothetical protein
MLHRAPMILMLLLVSAACAIPATSSRIAPKTGSYEKTVGDSTGRCDYGLEGASALGAAAGVLGIIRGSPAEQLAYMVPISAGLGWLWGRFLMPVRPRCRVPSGHENADTTQISRSGT